MKALLAGLLFGVALFSSASNAAQYPDSAKSTRNTVTVNVVWMTDHDEVDAICSAFAGIEPKGTIRGCYLPSNNVIYVVEPTSFNDHYHLLILGHEFWHALGADHP